MKMTKSEAESQVECPECHGYGGFTVPTKVKWQQRVTCSTCNGTGHITKWHAEALKGIEP